MASELKTLARINLTVAGTRQALSATSLLVEAVFLQADPANTGDLYIGDADVSATRALAVLDAREKIELRGIAASGGETYLDLKDIYFDGSATNDDLFVGYIKRSR